MAYKPFNLRSMYTRNRGEVLDNIMGYNGQDFHGVTTSKHWRICLEFARFAR